VRDHLVIPRAAALFSVADAVYGLSPPPNRKGR